MFSILLLVIYLAFISLGLPDSLLGSGWAVMSNELNVDISFAGIVSMIISAGTILASLLSDRLTKKFSTGNVTAFSVLLTAIALFGFSISNDFIFLCLWAIPYGLGAGAVDAALNNYVALHFPSKHMNWLHAFWGVGVSISPYIMGMCLTYNFGWNNAYLIVSIIQIVITFFIFMSLPTWRKIENANGKDLKDEIPEDKRPIKFKDLFKIKGIIFVLISFLCYCSLEQTAGLWASTYLVEHKDVSPETAASFGAIFYLGITLGRFLCGFISSKFGDKKLIRYGSSIIFIGIMLILIPFENDVFALIGLSLIGFGCSPIYPAIIHSTPFNFGKENSQAVIGIQMASAYIGITFMPPLFGLIAQYINISLFPVMLIVLWVIMVYTMEMLNKIIKKKRKNLN